jgi:RimJ/RimL family protein N-acetyltransferase
MSEAGSPLIVLRALSEEDAPTIHAWRADPSVRDGALGYPFASSVESEREWIRSFAPRGTPQDLCLGIRDGRTDALLGYCQVRSIDWIAKTAEFGIVVGAPESRGCGIGGRALALAMEYATLNLGLRRLWLRVVEFNTTAIRLYEKAGFQLEGRLPRHAYRNGRLHDVLIYGLEWPTSTNS